jgi:hypothetical protein
MAGYFGQGAAHILLVVRPTVCLLAGAPAVDEARAANGRFHDVSRHSGRQSRRRRVARNYGIKPAQPGLEGISELLSGQLERTDRTPPPHRRCRLETRNAALITDTRADTGIHRWTGGEQGGRRFCHRWLGWNNTWVKVCSNGTNTSADAVTRFVVVQQPYGLEAVVVA